MSNLEIFILIASTLSALYFTWMMTLHTTNAKSGLTFKFIPAILAVANWFVVAAFVFKWYFKIS